MLKRLFAAAVLFLLPSLALAQTVQQSGSVTPGHVSCWVTSGVVQDCGTTSNPKTNALGIYGNGGIPFGINSTSSPGASSAQYCELGFGTSNAAGATLYSFGQNGLTNCPLSFNINGSVYHFPFATGGNVVGPATTTFGSPAIWNNTSGTLLANSVGYLPNVIDNCGAKGNGSTADDAAFATCNSTYPAYTVPATANGYRIANAGGLVIPSNVKAYGLGYLPGNPPSGATIVCDLSVTPCLTISSGSNGTASATGLIQTRASGIVPANSIGVLVNESYNSYLSDVMAERDAEGFYFKMCGPYGISNFADHIQTATISDAHVVVDGVAELHVTNSRFGQNGLGDVNGTAYIRFDGPTCGTAVAASGPNTVHFDDDQFNIGTNNVSYGVQFINFFSGSPTPDATEFYFSDDHFEGVATADFTSDSSWPAINTLQVVNTVSNDLAPTFALNAATALNQVHFANTVFPGTFNLPAAGNAGDLDVTNSYLGAITLVGGMGNASFSNTTAYTFTTSGVFGTFSYLGGTLYGANYTNTATGSILIAIPGQVQVGFGGGGGSPGGSSGNVQYNNSSSFGGASYLNVSGSAPQLSLNQTNSAGNTILSVVNGATANSSQSILEVITGTANAYMTFTQADGSALEGVIGTGIGDTNGLSITTLAGPLVLSPYTSVNIPYMTASSAVCTDGSKNLTTAGCGGGSGVTWPTSKDLVVSNATNSPAGLAEVDGDCVLGAGGVWTAGSCGSGSSVSSVTGTSGQVTASPTTGNVVVSLPSTITQSTTFNGGLELAHSNSGGNTVFETLNNNTANSTQAVLEAVTGTANAYITITQADGTALQGVVGTGIGDTNGLTLTTLAGPISLAPNTNVEVTSGTIGISALTASVPVCTDSSKNLSSSCTTITGAGPVGTGSSIPVITYDNFGRLITVTTASMTAPAGALTGSTLASNVVSTSITSLGTLTSLFTGTISLESNDAIVSAPNGNRAIIQDNGSSTVLGNGSVNIITQNTVLPGGDSDFNLGGPSNVWASAYVDVYYVGATQGASCPSGINATTFVSVNGIVTHC